VSPARRALLALALLTSCNRPATQIVLRVDSDLRPGVELQGVFVTLRREGAAAPSFEQSYDLAAGTLTLPGTVGVVPGDADDARRLEVEARALLPGGDGFSTFATVSFQREQTLFLDLFLASRCRDPENRAGCGPDETCGPNGCEPIVRAMLPGFTADVPRREASTPEPVDAPDVPEPMDAPDVPEPMDAPDVPEPMDAPDVVDAPDVPLPTCGGQGQPCCPGSERCTDGGVCFVGVCTLCGTPGQPCCPMDICVSDARCAAGVCAPCGGDGQPCCAGNACSVGACLGGVCGGCGARGERCCANGACNDGSACAAGTCVACGGRGQPCCAGNACSTGNTCSAGACVACGGNGQPCCGQGCGSGLTCSSARCVPCGASGQPCCLTLFCNSGTACSGGRCVNCGGNGEPCCANNACDATGNLCVTASCAGGTCRHAVSPNGTQAGLGPSLRCCGGALVDTATNPSHCGGCNMGCATGICEAASAIPCGGGGFTGRCRCNGANAQCPVGANGRRQVCRGPTPYNNRCAPENQSACGAGTTFFDVSSCPNYCRF
jgi:hypothetical protein